MPRVPEYGAAPQVSPTALPGVRQAPSSNAAMLGQGARDSAQLGQGLMSAGDAMARIQIDMQNEANAVRVDDAASQAKAAALDLAYNQQSGFLSLKGDAALNRPDGKPLDQEYGEKLQQRLSEIADGLGNDAQKRAFQMKANDIVVGLRAQAQQHATQQYQAYKLSVQEGTAKTAANAIALDPLNEQNVTENADEIRRAVYNAGKMAGRSAEEITALQTETVSRAHTDALKVLMERDDTSGAQAYYEKYKDQLTGLARADIGEKLKVAGNALAATRTADEVWSQFGPKADGQPVELDKMETAVREKYSTDPLKAKATIAELRDRAAAFNSSEKERAAGNVNKVMQAYAQGASMARLQQMPEFLALPGEQKTQILEHVTDRAHMLMVRSEEDRNRAEANIARRGYGAFLVYSNPETLANMSEAQVSALLPVLGNQLTGHLMDKKRALSDSLARMTSNIDNEDFNSVADQMGLKPFESHKSDDDKAALGLLKYRVETLIDMAQRNKKAPLTRDEKQEVMRQEMARKVQVDNAWWFGSSAVPVIQMTPDQAQRVVVPTAERAKIVDALKTMYAKNPTNPAYAPTEDNVRRLYLRGQSPAAGLIPNAR
jgi:hypothetical protein